MTPEPSSRRPGAPLVVLSLVVLIAAGVILAVVLSGGGDSGTEAGPGEGLLPTAPASVRVTTARATVTVAPAKPGAWPVGVTDWTVVIATLAQKDHPRAAAERLAATVQAPGLVGRVLDSSQHPRLRPSVWIIYVGRYPTKARADRAARQLQAAGTRRGVVQRLTG